MPKKYKTQELCELACDKDYGGAIEFVPVAMRTEKVCKLSMKRSINNLPFVPVAFRNIDMCTKAFADNRNLVSYIPYELYVDVFEKNFKIVKENRTAEELYYLTGIGFFYKDDLETAISYFEKAMQTEDDTLKSNAKYMLGWTYFKKGDAEKAKFFYNESQKNKNVDFSAVYTEAILIPAKINVVDFDKYEFNNLIKNYQELSDSERDAEALAELDKAEKMLEDAQHSEMYLWATVWDYKRFVLYYLDYEKHLDFCKEKIKILEKETLWAYLEEQNPIRNTLRAMYNAIAYDIYEKATNYDEIKVGLKYIKKLVETVAPIEDKEVLYPFYETQALLYDKAQQYEPLIYKEKFEKAIAKIIKNKKQINEYLSEDFTEKYLT